MHVYYRERSRNQKECDTHVDDFISFRSLSICNLLNELRVASGALIITPHRNITILMYSSAMT